MGAIALLAALTLQAWAGDRCEACRGEREVAPDGEVVERWADGTAVIRTPLGGGRYAVRDAGGGALTFDLLPDHVVEQDLLGDDLSLRERVLRSLQDGSAVRVIYDASEVPSELVRGDHLAWTVRSLVDGAADTLWLEPTGWGGGACVLRERGRVTARRDAHGWRRDGAIDDLLARSPLLAGEEPGTRCSAASRAPLAAVTTSPPALADRAREAAPWLTIGATLIALLGLAGRSGRPVDRATIASSPGSAAQSRALAGEVTRALQPQVRAVLTAIGLPLDAGTLALEARVLADCTRLAARDPDWWSGARGAADAADIPLPVEPWAHAAPWASTPTLRKRILADVFRLPVRPHGLGGELAGRSPLVHRLVAQADAMFTVGGAGQVLDLFRAESAMWRTILTDQYGRLESCRRRPWSWSEVWRGPAWRAGLFLGEDLDDLYRGVPDATERVRAQAAAAFLDLHRALREPSGVEKVVRDVLIPLSAPRSPGGLAGIASLSWRSMAAPRPDPDLRRVRFWTFTALASALLVGATWGPALRGAALRASVGEGVGAVLALLPLLLATPLVVQAVVATAGALAAGTRRSPRVEPSARNALIEHLFERHLLTRDERERLLASPSAAPPRNALARQRLQQLIPHARPPIGWDELPSLTWFVSACGEKYRWSWEELVERSRQDGADTRLHHLATRYPDEWQNLLDDLARSGLPTGSLPRLGRNETPDELPPAAKIRVEDWANRRLPCNWRLIDSLEPLRAAFLDHARATLADPRRDELEARASLTPAERMELGRLRRELSLRVADKLQVVLRDDSVRHPTHLTGDAGLAAADLERRGWEYRWYPTDAMVHRSKYGGWGRALHAVRGEVLYGCDSHMELRFEDAPGVLGVLADFAADPALAVVVAEVQSYSEAHSEVAAVLGRAESVFGAVEQRRKAVTDAPINAGKSFLRTSHLLGAEGLQDDYVSEDAATAFRLMSLGLRVGWTDAVRLGWRTPTSLVAAAVPLGKYAAGSAEFLQGRAFARFLASERVPWGVKIGTIASSTFYLQATLAVAAITCGVALGWFGGIAPAGPSPGLVWGVGFLLASQALAAGAVVLERQRGAGLVGALARSAGSTVRGLPFHMLLLPVYAQRFVEGLAGRAVFVVTSKSPDLAPREGSKPEDLFAVPIALGLALAPLVIFGPLRWPALAAWAVPLLAVTTWVAGPFAHELAVVGARLDTGATLDGLRRGWNAVVTPMARRGTALGAAAAGAWALTVAPLAAALTLARALGRPSFHLQETRATVARHPAATGLGAITLAATWLGAASGTSGLVRDADGAALVASGTSGPVRAVDVRGLSTSDAEALLRLTHANAARIAASDAAPPGVRLLIDVRSGEEAAPWRQSDVAAFLADSCATAKAVRSVDRRPVAILSDDPDACPSADVVALPGVPEASDRPWLLVAVAPEAWDTVAKRSDAGSQAEAVLDAVGDAESHARGAGRSGLGLGVVVAAASLTDDNGPRASAHALASAWGIQPRDVEHLAASHRAVDRPAARLAHARARLPDAIEPLLPPAPPPAHPAPHHVTVGQDAGGFTLRVDGEPVVLHGVNWAVAPRGASYDWGLWGQPDAIVDATIARDLPLMRALGFDCVREYVDRPDGTDIPPERVRELYAEHGMYTALNPLAGRYGVTVGGRFEPRPDYADPAVRDAIRASTLATVARYANTPGLVLWMLGNEANLFLDEPGLTESERRARVEPLYTLYGEIAAAIHAIDPHHPVVAVSGEVRDADLLARLAPEVDVYGANLYRGASASQSRQPVNASAPDAWEHLREYGKPLLLTEFGADAWNTGTSAEDPVAQARTLASQWRDLAANTHGSGAGTALGGFVFEWHDEWWKHASGDAAAHDAIGSWNNVDYDDGAAGVPNVEEEWWGLAAQASDGPTFGLALRPAAWAFREVARDPEAEIDPLRFVPLYEAAMTVRGDPAAMEALGLTRRARP